MADQITIIMRTAYFVIVIFFQLSFSFAQVANPPRNLLPVDSGTQYKLSHQEYLELYGGNDTSAAVIDLFFRKRTNAKIKISMAPLPLIAGKAGLAIDERIQGGEDAIVLPFIGISSMVISAVIIVPLAVSGIYQMVFYSREKLKNILIDYEAGNPLPSGIRKKLKMGPKQWDSKTNDDVYH